MKLKKLFLPAILALSFFTFIKLMAAPGASVANATNVDNLQLDRNGIYDSTGTQRITVGADNTITGTLTVTGVVTGTGNEIISSPSKLYMGSASTAVSTATTANLSQGPIYTALLQAGGTAAAEGSCLIYAPPVGTNGVSVQISSATNALGGVIGIAAAAASTGSVVNVYDRGWVLALTTGTVNPGDLLQTTTLSTGYLAATVTSTNNIVGVSLGTGNSAGGLTRIKLR